MTEIVGAADAATYDHDSGRAPDRDSRMHALADHAADIIAVLHPDGYWEASDAGTRQLGYPKGFDPDGGVFSLIHPDDLVGAAEALAEVSAGPRTIDEPIEIRLRAADGTYWDYECSGIRADGLGVDGTIVDREYNSSINPIVAFPGAVKGGVNPKGGVVVWGQKTLQAAASALDRVNVRRLLIDIRRQVRDIAQSIIFEPNREATLARFSAAVTPRLQRIQALSGLERFKVVIDSSTTTQDDILNNTIRGKIFVQPTKSIEFVSLDFVVSNNVPQ